MANERKMIGVIFMDLKRPFETIDGERLLAIITSMELKIEYWNGFDCI